MAINTIRGAFVTCVVTTMVILSEISPSAFKHRKSWEILNHREIINIIDISDSSFYLQIINSEFNLIKKKNYIFFWE